MTGLFEVHCHILPNLDDGPDCMEESVRMLEMYYKDGVRKIYATPHFRKNVFEPCPQKVKEQYEKLKEKAACIGEGIQLLLGCEFHAVMDMIEILENRECLTMGNSSCVLVEFSVMSEFSFIRERCYTLLSYGYQPIIAHAERYSVLVKDITKIQELVEMGAYIQINAESILGKEGFAVKRFCRKLMDQNFIHFIGSDAHDSKKRKPLLGKCAEYVEKKMGTSYMRKLLIDNPEELIERE